MAGNEVFAAQRVQEVLAFIDQHLGERLTLPDMAQVLAINSYHFAHVFKQATGLAPHQYIIRRRLARAKQLLADTELPIAEVALAVGCANQSHFSAQFHRATGMTPLNYRLRNRRRHQAGTASFRYTASRAARNIVHAGRQSSDFETGG
jgi:AraC-like DNA-binding protein